MAESGGGAFGEGTASPSSPDRGYGGAVSSPSMVWGGTAAEIVFNAF